MEAPTTKTNKGWRNKLSNRFLILSNTSKKKNKRENEKKKKRSSSISATCIETMRSRLSALEDPLEYGRRMGWLSAPSNNNTRDDKNYERLGNTATTSSTDRERTDVNSDSMSERANTPLSACDSDNDDNKLTTTTEESKTEVDGSKKRKKEKKSHAVRPSALEYGRQMGWLSTSASKISDTKNTTKLPAGESESKAKGEGTKADSLEYHQGYYTEMQEDINTTLRTQTAIESVTQKKSNVVRPSALEYGRKMGWVP